MDQPLTHGRFRHGMCLQDVMVWQVLGSFAGRLISRSVTFPVLQCLYAVEKSCERRLLWKSHCCLSSSLIFLLWESVLRWQVNYCKREFNHDRFSFLCSSRLDGRNVVLRNHYWGSAFSEALTLVWWVVYLAIWLNTECTLLWLLCFVQADWYHFWCLFIATSDLFVWF